MIVNLASKAIENANAVERENNQVRAYLKKNEDFLKDFDLTIGSALKLQQELKEKRAQIERAKRDLIEVQSSIIGALKMRSQDRDDDSASNDAIPLITGKVQKLLFDLTDIAVDGGSASVSILEILKGAETLNKLFDALVESKIVNESEEERERRLSGFSSGMRETVTALGAIIKNFKAATEPKVIEAPDLQPE